MKQKRYFPSVIEIILIAAFLVTYTQNLELNSKLISLTNRHLEVKEQSQADFNLKVKRQDIKDVSVKSQKLYAQAKPMVKSLPKAQTARTKKLSISTQEFSGIGDARRVLRTKICGL
jgi:hypothetical protein